MNTLTIGGWGTSSLIHQIRKMWDKIIELLKALGPWFMPIIAVIVGFEWKAWKANRKEAEQNKIRASKALQVSVETVSKDINKVVERLDNLSEKMSYNFTAVYDKMADNHNALKEDVKNVSDRVSTIEGHLFNPK